MVWPAIGMVPVMGIVPPIIGMVPVIGIVPPIIGMVPVIGIVPLIIGMVPVIGIVPLIIGIAPPIIMTCIAPICWVICSMVSIIWDMACIWSDPMGVAPAIGVAGTLDGAASAAASAGAAACGSVASVVAHPASSARAETDNTNVTIVRSFIVGVDLLDQEVVESDS